MKFKRMIGFLLTACLVMGLLPVSAVQTFAATEIKNIALTGDVTPVAGESMTFPTVESNQNYTIVQAWVNQDSGKSFTNSDEWNNELDEVLMPEDERVFEENTTYSFAVLVIAQNADVEFASDMTVSVEKYGKMNFAEALGNSMVGYELVFNIDIVHTHVKSSEYGKNDESHWGKCVNDDGFVFDYTEEPHNVDSATGICEECGYIAKADDATKIVSQPETSITVDCGDTIELTVVATGRNLSYSWRYKDEPRVDFYDRENYGGYGFNVSGSHEATLKIENCNQMLESKLPVVCYVKGMWGEVETEEVNIEVTHRSEIYVAVDDTGHRVRCVCGKLMQSIEAHDYNSENICKKCGYEKGTARTRFQEATLELPDFSDKDNVSTAKASATLSGMGIKEGTAGIRDIVFFNSGNLVSDNVMLEEEKVYVAHIYPELEDNFYMDTEKNFLIYVTYDGINKRGYAEVDDDGRCYVPINLGKPYVRKVAEFYSNGGEGRQSIVRADEHDYIYFPTCSFSKTNDEFYAWEYKGKLYAEDPNEYQPVHIDEEYAQVNAVWRSELTDNVEITMDYPKNGDKVSDVGFYAPIFENRYSIVGATWYEDNYQEITNNDLGLELGENETLDKTKNYNVRIAVTGKGFASNDKLKLFLNNQSIEDIKRNGLQAISFVLRIRGGTNISLTEPTEGVALDLPSEITVNNNIMTIDETNTYWSRNDNESGKYEESTVAVLNEQYYLNCWFTYNVGMTNTILFGNTVLVNGTEYTVKKIGNNYIRIVVPFTAKKLSVTVSEDSGLVYIKSPKAMKVTFAMALYESGTKLKELIWETELELKKGSNEVDISKIDLSKAFSIIYRNRSDKAKVMVFESAETLKPLCNVHNYKFRQSKY